MSRIDTKARIAAIRTEIAEHGHHPGPDSLVSQDLLALCDDVDRLMAENADLSDENLVVNRALERANFEIYKLRAA